MVILSAVMFIGLVVLAIAIAGWLHVGCCGSICAPKV